jgi:NAD(P)-dependent dehydrogenase (short-subunit alcohol dehydrogenase family)
MSERPVITITGGGRGIGAATAKLAAARGHANILAIRAASIASSRD